MNLQATQLSRALKQQTDFLINELIKFGYYKTPDGKQLHELTLTELQQIYENVKCQTELGPINLKG